MAQDSTAQSYRAFTNKIYDVKEILEGKIVTGQKTAQPAAIQPMINPNMFMGGK